MTYGAERKTSPAPDFLTTYKVHPTTGQELQIAVWTPPSDKCAADCPTLLFFHSGSWRKGNLRQVMPWLVDELNSLGAVVASAEYTFLSSQTNITDCYRDGRDALLWLHAHADDYGVDISRVTLSGVSAGAWIASIVGNLHPELAIGIMAIAGRHDLTTGRDTWIDSRQREVCGDLVSSGAACWHDYSPVNHVTSSSPPTLLIHGTNDATVPYGNSRKLRDALERAGVPVCLVRLPGDGHAFAHIIGGVGHQTAVNLAGPFVTQQY